MDEVLKNIFRVNLGVSKNESVLVFTDLIREEEGISKAERRRREDLRRIASTTATAGAGFCNVVYVERPSTMGHGKEPDEELWRAAFGPGAVDELQKGGIFGRILAKTAKGEDAIRAEAIIKRHGTAPQAIVALSNYSTSHTRFRDFLTRCLGVRYASMPLFEGSMLSGVMTADWGAVKARTERVVEKLEGSDMVFITSHNGTSISFSIKGRKVLADTGVLTEKGSFSNLPAGEAFTAPVEGTAEGVLVLEWAPTQKLSNPIEVIVKKGRAIEVSGKGPFAGELKKRIEEEPLAGNVAELGIGTNDRATRPDNILESEKILGTVHIALGDNSSFGGRVSVPFHEDFIFFKPTLEAVRGEEKVTLLLNGEPRF